MRGIHAACIWVTVLVGSSTVPIELHAQQEKNQEEPSNADTASVSLARAIQLALNQNPDFVAAVGRLRAVEGDLRGARTYRFNPSFELEAPGGDVLQGARPFEARLEQEIEWFGARGLRTRAGEHGFASEGARAEDAARVLTAEVGRAFYALAGAEERLRVTRELSALNGRLQRAVVIQLAEGEVSQLQGNLALIETARARALVLDLSREVEAVRIELARLLGLSSLQTPVTMGADADPPATVGRLAADSLMDLALSRRPDLRAGTSRVEQATALDRLAGREALPTVSVAGLITREVGETEPRYGISFQIPIPLFDRNLGSRDRATAEVLVARQGRRASELLVRAEVSAAIASYRAASEETLILYEDLLIPVRENQGLLEVAYQEGKIDLPTLLLLRNQLLDGELTYWNAWTRKRQAWVALEAATGANPERWIQAIEHQSEVAR